MRLKKLGAALFVVAALSAVLAGSAFATATTTAANWYTGAAPGTKLTGSSTVTAEQKAGVTGKFVTTVSGKEVIVTATGVECLGCKITNEPTGASGTGKLKFTGVSVDAPAHCTTTSTIETKELTVNADYMEGESAYVKFTPTKGEETAFATFELSGAECALATSISPKGSVFGLAANHTGVQAASQEVSFSGEINKTAGGSLHVGTEAATLSTVGIFKDGGTLFGVH